MVARIVLLLGGTPTDEKSCLVAALIAKRLVAAVEGLSIKIDPSELMYRLGEGVAASAIDDIVKAAEENSDAAAARGRDALERAARRVGLEIFAAPRQRKAAGVSAQEVQGPALDVLTQAAALADLAIFGEPGDAAPLDLLAHIEHVLLRMRRPILIARGNVADTLGERILVSFNGSVEACSALTHAAPLLARAKSVEILHLCENEALKGVALDAQRYVRQCGGDATILERALSGRAIGEEIASRAKESGADLIVMGGYGRSRLRELVLGGATRFMVHSAPVPVFMAH